MGAKIAKAKQVSRNPTAFIKNVDRVLEEKVISPRHPSTVKAFDKLVKENPGFVDSTKQKNENLHDMLNSVRVDSTGAAPTDILKSGKRARKLNIAPEGKLDERRIEELFLNKKIAPKDWTPERVAEEYKLDAQVAANLLANFSSFYIIKNSQTAAMTLGSGQNFLQPDKSSPDDEFKK